MSWKLMVAFAIPWAVMALLGSLGAMATDPAAGTSGAAYGDLVNTISNPDVVGLDTPTIGASSNPVGMIWEMAKQGTNWLGFMANAAILNYDFLMDGWLSMLRYIMLAMAGPLMFMVARDGVQMLGNLVGGIGGIF